ncbi:MAG TPA: hypothetical protein VEB64_12380 [Azospirillaceae bacterium]|nr:hypothetical protein [Azospirillaceae bacterium]
MFISAKSTPPRAIGALATEGAPPASRRPSVQWDTVAVMLGRGATVTGVAEHFGVSRVTVWRRMRADDRFRRLVEETQANARAEAAGRVEDLREDVARQLRRLVKAGNVRVVLWLAKELGVVRRDYAGMLAEVAATPSVFEATPSVFEAAPSVVEAAPSVVEDATPAENARNYVAPATAHPIHQHPNSRYP